MAVPQGLCGSSQCIAVGLRIRLTDAAHDHLASIFQFARDNRSSRVNDERRLASALMLRTAEKDVTANRAFNAGFEASVAIQQNPPCDGAKTYVSLRGNKAVGYYSLAYSSVEYDLASEKMKKGLGRYPVPAILLARLAVDKRFQGKGIWGRVF